MRIFGVFLIVGAVGLFVAEVLDETRPSLPASAMFVTIEGTTQIAVPGLFYAFVDRQCLAGLCLPRRSPCGGVLHPLPRFGQRIAALPRGASSW